MRRSILIAATVVGMAIPAAATAATTLTHTGARYYSRTIPKPCFARPPAGHPRRLARGCACPRGEVATRPATATYRFRLRAGHPFRFAVAWRFFAPKVATNQSGAWSYVKVRGP